MHANVLAPLSQQFPSLSFAIEVDQWLKSIRDKPIVEQLRERRIAKVNFCEYVGMDQKSEVLGELVRIGENFFLMIKDNQTIDEKVFTLGHELAHAFEDRNYFSFFIVSSAEDFPKFITDMVWELYLLIERFCDAFAEQWIAINGKDKVVSFLQQGNFGA